MTKFLMVGTKGTDDPTAATFPFAAANAAVAQGHEATIALRWDAVLLMKDAVADTIRGVGIPAFKEVFATTLKNKIPIYI